MSLMEAVVPEQFWTDKTQCRYQDENGQIQNPTLPDCAQGISAVKAIAIAQSQGQKIYTITHQNASTALSKLPIGGSVGQEIRNAVFSGKEVTIHEKPINIYGWSGYGYVIVDPETGNGAYLVEGNGNGGVLDDDDGIISWFFTVLPSVLKKMAGAVFSVLVTILESFRKLMGCDNIPLAILTGVLAVVISAVIVVGFNAITGPAVLGLSFGLVYVILGLMVGILSSMLISYFIDATANSLLCNNKD
jgi:hypothetical protein